MSAEQTMITIVRSTTRSSSLFSSIISYFYISPHNTARFVLMKCIGEAIHNWDASYISNKKSEIIRLVLTGIKDRTGDVRDAARIVFCQLYCCLLPLLSFIHTPELTDDDCFYFDFYLII